jgi:hypothetical protein
MRLHATREEVDQSLDSLLVAPAGRRGRRHYRIGYVGRGAHPRTRRERFAPIRGVSWFRIVAPRFRTVVRRGSRPGLSGRRSGRAPRTSTGPGMLNTAIRHREVAPSQSGVLARGARINDWPKMGGTPRTRKMASMRPAAAIGLQRLFPLVIGRAHGVASSHPYRVSELRTRRRHHRVAGAYSGLLRTRCSHRAGHSGEFADPDARGAGAERATWDATPGGPICWRAITATRRRAADPRRPRNHGRKNLVAPDRCCGHAFPPPPAALVRHCP